MRAERLLIAATTVSNYTRACAKRGDIATFDTLTDYYSLADECVTGGGGRCIKVMGDSVLATFPAENPAAAVDAVRRLREEAGQLWHRFDARCEVWAKIGVGSVVVGQLGTPGAERLDVVGDTVNKLFKPPWGDLIIMPEVEALLE